jgi:hypothetical protein
MNVFRDRSKRRYIVERTFNWFGDHRRQVVRYEQLWALGAFLVIDVILLVLLCIFPELATWLPAQYTFSQVRSRFSGIMVGQASCLSHRK